MTKISLLAPLKGDIRGSMIDSNSKAGTSAKRTIVISGVSLREGGPLSILKDCMRYADTSWVAQEFEIVALVSRISFFDDLALQHIKLIEYPWAKNTYVNRLYLEYIAFRSVAKKMNASYWLSMQDITPNVGKVPQAVYFHNPSPFYTFSFRDFFLDPTFGAFMLWYKWLYKINVRRNRFVIVQQSWIRNEIASAFGLSRKKIIVAYPSISIKPIPASQPSNKMVFFFPTLPRVHKNIEVLGEAVKLIRQKHAGKFEILVTISGDENKYAALIHKKFNGLEELRLIGRQPRERVFDMYASSDCLVFPSKLETWGLPISEFKVTGKPMLLADLPYARETLGDYPKACFFDPNSPEDLARKLDRTLSGENIFSSHTFTERIDEPVVDSWATLFHKLIKDDLETV